MKFVEPDVFLIGETKIREDELQRFLTYINAENWTTTECTDGEKLIEIMGRICYDSFVPGNNLNVSKVREGNETYLANILSSKHGSVLEHCLINFVFTDISKIFSEELVRHRVGTAISGESGRYVRRNELIMWVPDTLKNLWPNSFVFFKNLMRVFDWYIKYTNKYSKIDEENMPFSRKKIITSALRRFLPIGKAATYGWSANFRTLRHVINMRTSPHAEEEMIFVFNKVAKLCIERYPNVFQDVEIVPIVGTSYNHFIFE